MIKKVGFVAGLIAVAAAAFACSSSSSGGNSSSACVYAGADSSCQSCMQNSCGSQVSSGESACSAYLSCACPGGTFSESAASASSCQMQVTSACSSAEQAIVQCESSNCASACTTSGSSSGGSSGGIQRWFERRLQRLEQRRHGRKHDGLVQQRDLDDLLAGLGARVGGVGGDDVVHLGRRNGGQRMPDLRAHGLLHGEQRGCERRELLLHRCQRLCGPDGMHERRRHVVDEPVI